MPLLREDEALILVSVNDANGNPISLPTEYSWQSISGGDMEASSLNVRPGGILNAISLGGPAKRNDITVKHVYGSSAGLQGYKSFHHYLTALDAACGVGRMTVSLTPLDADGNVQGGTLSFTGTLKTVQHPTFDANSTNVATLGLVMDCDLTVN